MTTELSDIDAVITWVDGDDPAHQTKRREALLGSGTKYTSTKQIAAGRDLTRFLDNGELRYCLFALERFAPWLRRIHIITDNQRPQFLAGHSALKDKLNFVDHQEIFRDFEWALPTFNSRSIESVMWRIPGLAEKFIYFNDDFVLTRPQSPENYFDGDKVVLQGDWKRLRLYSNTELALHSLVNRAIKKILGVTRTMHLLAQMRGAQLAGQEDKYLRTSHAPHPLRRDTLARYYAENPQALEHNISFAFRDTSQYLAVLLANHLEISRDNAVCIEPEGVGVIAGESRSADATLKTISAMNNGELDSVCLNSIEKLDNETRELLEHSLQQLLEITL